MGHTAHGIRWGKAEAPTQKTQNNEKFARKYENVERWAFA